MATVAINKALPIEDNLRELVTGQGTDDRFAHCATELAQAYGAQMGVIGMGELKPDLADVWHAWFQYSGLRTEGYGYSARKALEMAIWHWITC